MLANKIPRKREYASGSFDGRALHGVLGVRRDFSTWMKSRIGKYGFVEGQDYEKIVNGFMLPQTGEASSNGLQSVAIEYACALDMSKELCMVENNEKGRVARRYFIECERQLLTGQPALDATLAPAQQNDIHNILSAKIAMLPKEQQGGVWPQSWERLKRHFKVAKYDQIPQSRYGGAVTYLIGMEITPRALPKPEPLALPAPAFDPSHYMRAMHLHSRALLDEFSDMVLALKAEHPMNWNRQLDRHSPDHAALPMLSMVDNFGSVLDGTLRAVENHARAFARVKSL